MLSQVVWNLGGT
ncbi:rCG39268, partial [Rattus norvegicus]